MYHLWVLEDDGSQSYVTDQVLLVAKIFATPPHRRKLVSGCCHAVTYHVLTSEHTYCSMCERDTITGRKSPRRRGEGVRYWN
jgi:hypothetical protein